MVRQAAGEGVGDGGGVDVSSLRFLVFWGGELAGLVGVVYVVFSPYSVGTMFSSDLPEVLCASAGVGE